MNPFLNASVLNEGHLANFVLNRLPRQRPLSNRKKGPESGSIKFTQIAFIRLKKS